MEKLTYTNAKGQSIEMAQSFPIFLKSFTGTGDLGFDVQQDKAPFQDGTTYLDSVSDKRNPAIQLVIISNSQQELNAQRLMLGKVFNPKLGKGILKYENDDISKEIEVYLESSPKYPVGSENKGNLFQNVLIETVAPLPFWLDIFKTTEFLAAVIPLFQFELEIDGDGIEFGSFSDGVVDIENIGDVSTPVKIEFFGPVTDPRITNETTGEFIELITPLLEGEKMTITTAFGNKRVEITKVNGTIENAFQSINLESSFFQLVTGTNRINFTASAGSEDAELTITYRNRYVAV